MSRKVNSLHYHSQSSEEDFEQENNRTYKITGKSSYEPNKYNYKLHQQQSSQSSLSEDSSQKNQKPSKKHFSEDEESDREEDDSNSIENIEERIKRLEKDLQSKIDKHKKNYNERQINNEKTNEQKLKSIKNMASPPLLPKKDENKRKETVQQIQTKKEKKFDEIHAVIDAKPKNIKSQKIESHSASIKEDQNKKNIPVRNKQQGIRKQTEIEDTESKTKLKKQLDEANKQIVQLKKTIQKLKTQNTMLRKNGKKSQQLNELKKLESNSKDKLQKQLQLLKIIEKLELKLKKSINKKLNGRNKKDAFLHKGLPINIQ